MVTFERLSEAVAFLAAALDDDDLVGLEAASGEPLPAPWVLERLRESHAEVPLTQRYAGREFPPDAKQCKLGGHDAELGHLHIDFARREGGWTLARIWMCR